MDAYTKPKRKTSVTTKAKKAPYPTCTITSAPWRRPVN